MLIKNKNLTSSSSTVNIKGRILCIYLDAAFGDDFGEIASKKYLDENGVPPWDTWIYYSNTDIEKPI